MSCNLIKSRSISNFRVVYALARRQKKSRRAQQTDKRIKHANMNININKTALERSVTNYWREGGVLSISQSSNPRPLFVYLDLKPKASVSRLSDVTCVHCIYKVRNISSFKKPELSRSRSFLSVAWPTGAQLMFFFSSGVSKLFGAQGSPSSGSLLIL